MDSEADRAAIFAVMHAETEAWMCRNFEALAAHWVHSPQTRRLFSLGSSGAFVLEGWDAVGDQIRQAMAQAPEVVDPTTRLSIERINIVIGGDMAWASYDLIGTNTGDNFELAGLQHELKIFQRVDGQWKIGCVVSMQPAVDHETCPLIEVGPDGKILWMNDQARLRMVNHSALLMSGGRLKARNRGHQLELQDAFSWGFHLMQRHIPPTMPNRPSRVVILGENDEAAPLFCWVMVQDRKVLVSFDDEKMLERRISSAQQIYRLSATQVQLALLLVRGRGLPTAAAQLGVSVNTVRTHLQRMFERTGVRSQPALVGVLLSAEVPSNR